MGACGCRRSRDGFNPGLSPSRWGPPHSAPSGVRGAGYAGDKGRGVSGRSRNRPMSLSPRSVSSSGTPLNWTTSTPRSFSKRRTHPEDTRCGPRLQPARGVRIRRPSPGAAGLRHRPDRRSARRDVVVRVHRLQAADRAGPWPRGRPDRLRRAQAACGRRHPPRGGVAVMERKAAKSCCTTPDGFQRSQGSNPAPATTSVQGRGLSGFRRRPCWCRVWRPITDRSAVMRDRQRPEQRQPARRA